MGFKMSESERLYETEKENRMLRAQLEKASADLEYVAMMTDVDIDEEEPDE